VSARKENILTLAAVLALLFASIVALRARTAWEFAQDARNGRLITVEIGGNELYIPQHYFLPADVPTDSKRNDIWIHALWPDMAPMREDNKDRYIRVRGHGPLLNILAIDQRHITTVDFRLNVEEKLGAPYSPPQNRFGLEAIFPKDVKPPDMGELRQEIYVNKGSDGLIGFITCNPPGSVPEPGCEYEFNYRGLLLQVDYGKYFLPQWREIDQSVRDLFDSFTTHALRAAPMRVAYRPGKIE